VRELLARGTGQSLGVVAFSEAQQGEIENALTRLGAEDAVFLNRLESEYEREENGQFCGLFVKNLENVQGDERDIILLSVCYGYDRNRKMLMNFGPINQRGGEKRLNVIFSRARQHMAVVSSIRHFDITNEYNDGANCLRNFLEYAAACSAGESATSRRVLQSSNPVAAGRSSTTSSGNEVASQIAEALRERGLIVDLDVGQSMFRLPLAVRQSSDEAHRLGILIDDTAHYAQSNLLERYLLRGEVLEAFGWRVVQVYVKDWYHERDAVLRQIEQALAGEIPETEVQASDEVSPLAAEAPGSYDATLSTGTAAEILPSIIIQQTAIEAAPIPRRFFCTEDGASKFWEVAINGSELTVSFGRIGTKGQSQTKTFATPDAAMREREKLVRSKLGKNYIEETTP
jgi:predicted DNA-binding WGR domain protein